MFVNGNLKAAGDESKEVSKLMLQKVLLLPAKRNLNTQPEGMTMATPTPVSRVPSIQTLSYVGGPSNEITISEPEPLQVLQMINSLQLRARWTLKSRKPAGRSGFLGSVCGTARARWCHSQPEQASHTPFTSSPWKCPFGHWNSKEGLQLSTDCCAIRTVISPATPSWVPLAHHGQPSCISPSSEKEILFLGISHLPHSHHPGTAP